MNARATVSWSGGKDAALALNRVLRGDMEVVSLHTVFNSESRRVGMHGVGEELIEAQAASIGLPLTKLYLEASEGHEAYRSLMESFFDQCAREKIDVVVFGDIFLEDLRAFRNELLKRSGLLAVYPLWKEDSTELVTELISNRFRTIVCAADAKHFSPQDVGCVIDGDFIKSLRPGVDPCGENGEFHTFVFDGPVFKHAIAFTKGNVVSKSYHYQVLDREGKRVPFESSFWFQELSPRMAL